MHPTTIVKSVLGCFMFLSRMCLKLQHETTTLRIHGTANCQNQGKLQEDRHEIHNIICHILFVDLVRMERRPILQSLNIFPCLNGQRVLLCTFRYEFDLYHLNKNTNCCLGLSTRFGFSDQCLSGQ